MKFAQTFEHIAYVRDDCSDVVKFQISASRILLRGTPENRIADTNSIVRSEVYANALVPVVGFVLLYR